MTAHCEPGFQFQHCPVKALYTTYEVLAQISWDSFSSVRGRVGENRDHGVALALAQHRQVSGLCRKPLVILQRAHVQAWTHPGLPTSCFAISDCGFPRLRQPGPDTSHSLHPAPGSSAFTALWMAHIWDSGTLGGSWGIYLGSPLEWLGGAPTTSSLMCC